jgi:hypothetical protein
MRGRRILDLLGGLAMITLAGWLMLLSALDDDEDREKRR